MNQKKTPKHASHTQTAGRFERTRFQLRGKHLATRTTALVTLAAFSNYSLLTAHAAQGAKVNKPMSEVVTGLADDAAGLMHELDVIHDQLKLEKHSQKLQRQAESIQMAAIMKALQELREPTHKGPVDAAPQKSKLQQLADQARAAGQTALADSLTGPNGILRPGGPLLGTTDAAKALQGLAGIDKNSSKEDVERVVKEFEGCVKTIAAQANATLDSFRAKVRALPKEVLKKLCQRALDGLKEGTDPELRKTVESYLPPDLRGEITGTQDLRAFLGKLQQEEKYPEVFFEILKSEGLLTLKPNGDLDLSKLGLTSSEGQLVTNVLPLFQCAERAHDAALETGLMAQSLLTDAMMTGNPWIIGAAFVLAILMMIFGGGDGDGDSHGDASQATGQGPDEDGKNDGIPHGDNPQPKPSPTPPVPVVPAPTPGGGQIVIPHKAGADFDLTIALDGEVTITGKLPRPFKIPVASYQNIGYDLVAGDADPEDSTLVLNWKEQFIDGINYLAATDTVEIQLGGSQAPENQAPRLKNKKDGSEIAFKTLKLSFQRTGDNVGHGKVAELGAPLHPMAH